MPATGIEPVHGIFDKIRILRINTAHVKNTVFMRFLHYSYLHRLYGHVSEMHFCISYATQMQHENHFNLSTFATL